MVAATRLRLAIAQKSLIQQRLNYRPQCEKCMRVLTVCDLKSYWDGCPELERKGAVPRVCENCAECKSA